MSTMKTEWHEGWPPSIGWWPASVKDDPTSLRWWNGKSWSSVVREGATDAVIAEAVEWAFPPGQDIKWAHRPQGWPPESYT